jgi:hypothetical protein
VFKEDFLKTLFKYFPQIYLTANSIIYGILVFLFVVDSNTWFANLGILPRNPVGLTELKTMYIGLMAAIGIFSILATLFSALRLAGLIFALISYSMLAGVRSYGIFVDGFSSDLMTQLLLVEIISALLALIALFSKSSN